MRELLGGELGPVTWEIGFLETEAARAAEQFAAWQSSLSKLGLVKYMTRPIQGALRSLLCELAPLTSVQRERFLFAPTRSRWTAYFDNGHQGTDAVSAVSVLARDLGCRGIRAVATPDENSDRGGAVIFELYGPQEEDFLNYQRTLGVIREGGRWEFWETGSRLPFEKPERYNARNVRDRFTSEMLEQYLAEFAEIRFFDEDFYTPESEAFLVERKGRRVPRVKEYPLNGCAETSRN
jgi:hypothetical protein